MPSTFRMIPIFAIFLILAITMCVSAEPRQAGDDKSSHSEHSIGRRLTAKGVPNFGEVTPTLYRSGQPSHAGFEALAKMGVQIVVDAHATNQSEKKEAARLGMEYVSIPWHCPWPKDEAMAKFLTVLRENPGKKILLHCRLGDDRTGMMVAAYRMADEGWSAEEAMKEMRAFGFSAVHHAMCPGLADYEEKFPERLKSSPAFKELRSEDAPEKSK